MPDKKSPVPVPAKAVLAPEATKKTSTLQLSPKIWLAIVALLGLGALEIALRLIWGLGSPVLSQRDPSTGYRFQPNQKIVRFGKYVEYNQFSQRSEPITKEKPQGTLRILMIGDSVLNGGNPIDQSQIITELLKNKILSNRQSVQILNASAGSWGIGNQLGYIEEFGTFQSDAIVLQIGTHDLTQPKSTSDAVGRETHPDRAPLLATQELISRYIIPKVMQVAASSTNPTAEIPQTKATDQEFVKNMDRLKQIIQRVRTQEIPIWVMYTPNRADVIPQPETPPYKTQFLATLKQLNVPIIDLHTNWSNLDPQTVSTYFRDVVHLSESGNQAASDLLFQELCQRNHKLDCRQHN